MPPRQLTPAKASTATRLRGPTWNLIMEISVGNPLMTPEQVAAIASRNATMVRAVMRSDEFLEQRARLLLERYGDKMANVRHKIFDVADALLEAINAKIADPAAAASPETLLEAAKWLLPFVTAPAYDPDAKTPPPAANTTINLLVSPEDAAHARQLQATRAGFIDIPANPSPPQQLRRPGSDT
jgi:hypothetical protein